LAGPLHQTRKQGHLATDETQNTIVHNVIVDAAVEPIVKPFSLDTLAVKVDRVLPAIREGYLQAFRSSGAVFQSVRRWRRGEGRHSGRALSRNGAPQGLLQGL
jgi:hypothetical protein